MNQYENNEGKFVEFFPGLSDDQIELIAERAATKAVAKLTDQLYVSVGRSVVEKFLFIIGVLYVGVFIYLTSKGEL